MGQYEYGIGIGVSNVHVAEVVADDRTGTVYDDPVKICDTISINPTANTTGSTLDADNKVIREENVITSYNISINAAALSQKTLAFIGGHKIDADGCMVVSDDDVAPEFAMGYERLLDSGARIFHWFYKGVFGEPTENAETLRKGQKNYQTPTIVYTGGRRYDGKMKISISEEETGYSAAKADSWFEAVVEPAATGTTIP